MKSRYRPYFGFLALFAMVPLPGCLCSDTPPDETDIEPPLLTSLRSSSDNMETGRTVSLEAEVRAPENTAWHLFWDSSCGLVVPSPSNKSQASFLASDTPRLCTVTATVRDADMDHPSSRQIQIRVNERLEKEIVR